MLVPNTGIETMIRPPAISKNMPRGQPFRKGKSGNPRGRPKRTPEEVQLIEACRAKTPEALDVVAGLMQDSPNDRVRLAAAQFIIERGYGKAPERIEILEPKDEGPLPGAELTPREAYWKIVHGHCEDAVFEDILRLAQPQGDAASLEDILAERET